MYPVQADIRVVVPQGALVPRVDIGGIYTLTTTGKASTEAQTVDYGFNPCAWKALPNEGILLWKVRHPVTTEESAYAVNVVIPTSGSARSTVTSPNTITGTSKVPVVDNKGTQTVGSDITNPTTGSETSAYTEHLVYFNKCAGTFRLLGVKSTTGAAEANSGATPAAAKSTK